MRRTRLLGWLLAAVPAWFAMQGLHELGHVLHAVVSGGTVKAVHVRLLGFSETVLHEDPHPHFVAWGGVVWGSLLPLVPLLVARAFCRRAVPAGLFFAGFCLVGNGAYLAGGTFVRAGDTFVMLLRGSPAWLLVLTGSLLVAARLGLWHRLGVVRPSRSLADG